jgi:putative ABC transport system permease protein
MSENPSQGMRPRAPKNAKTILIEHIKPLWMFLSAAGKLTFRSMFRYKMRILLSCIGIIGA